MYYHIRRQPIFNIDLSVYGYELRCRHSLFDFKGGFDGDQTMSQAILNCFI